MVGKDDARKMFWRSASWSASRSAGHNPIGDNKDFVDPDGSVGNINGETRRYPPAPLTPRSQQNCKARSFLPPLQPLSIARRSLDEWPKASSDDIGEWPHPPTPSGRGNGERLKLDLSSIQRNPDKNAGLVKRDKIAYFDKECSKVAEHIYLGGDAVARDREILKQNGITHILNCVGFVCPEYFKSDFVYRTLWLQDSPTEDITSILYDVFDYFEDVREQNGRVFVHCCQGVSRSTSLVIAYVMWREGQSFDDAFQYVKAARGIADPNMGFACQLLQCQKRVHAFPLSPSSLLRMYRIAPHSPYDPLHLVPKMLTNPSPSALDSRGAFIIHIPSAIYVWIGNNCEAIMERDARGAACQIVRYEKVQGSISLIKEGEEPDYFWEAFSKFLPLMDKSDNRVENGKSSLHISPGERRVESYNVDFEVFQKAIMGGFVPPFASAEDELETHLPARESCWSVLRRKFASANMKEFVSEPKLSYSRVYLDSVSGTHSLISSSPSHSLSSSTSSSSSPYLSPDSISSDSSNSSKCSETSLDSPYGALTSTPASSSLSNFSNLSLLSSSCSSQPVTKGAVTCSVKLASQPCHQSASLLLKKPSTSLAERRGSLSKSLKLPLMNDKTLVMNRSSTFNATREDGAVMNGSARHLHQSDGIENSSDVNNHVKGRGLDSTQQSEVLLCSGAVDSVDYNKASFVGNCSYPWVRSSSREDIKSTSSNGMDGSGLLQSNNKQNLVYQWPSLEKIVTFSASHLDSKAAFVIFSSSTSSGKHARNILYFWLGSSFSCATSQDRLDSNREIDCRGGVDWNQVGCDILAHFGLPNDTIIKIVKESEEPEEFLALLSTL
ncbi:protein-tyrosine-phosphatase MKP1 [Prosopis cineraria]|uniref:protein-tyrosine-phosphatase MKP1 n=1 Tax=Prosopis cineraria TaxID=364024 RepID=UPI0024109D55|nr:protein-tyrosine-phosphatase MKP1 [Prosopis cineraria]